MIPSTCENTSIEVYGGDCKPSYTPIFVHDRLVAVFYSWDTRFISSRERILSAAYTWPRERIYINRATLLHYWAGKITLIKDDIIEKDKIQKDKIENDKIQTACAFIDPSRDSRMVWSNSAWKFDATYSNIDLWVTLTQNRILALKSNTAKTTIDPAGHMAVLGVMIAVLACVNKSADHVDYLHEFEEIINQEAWAYFRSGLNYTFGFQVLYKADIIDYPYTDLITETMVVKLDILQLGKHLMKLGLAYVCPYWKGFTYLGIKQFKVVARLLFIAQWKEFSLRLLKNFPADGIDPAFSDFRSQVRLKSAKPSSGLKSANLSGSAIRHKIIIETSAELLFPVVSDAAPPCMHKLFSAPPLKHYARWQLGELAVDMGWSKNNLMAHYLDTNVNRAAVGALYSSYEKKPPARNLCKIWHSKGYCPYSTATFDLCAGGPIADMEDYNPAAFFQRRLAASR